MLVMSNSLMNKSAKVTPVVPYVNAVIPLYDYGKIPIFSLAFPHKTHIIFKYTPYSLGILFPSQAERNQTLWKSTFKMSV